MWVKNLCRSAWVLSVPGESLRGGGQEGLRMGKYGALGGVRGDGAPS